MAGQSTHYLVDFENVGESGIKTSEMIPDTDYVYLFSTKNSPKVNMSVMSVLVNHNLSKLKVFVVPEGKQSVDKHLLAYLGYLIGKYAKRAKYVIVSKDTGYDAISAFLKQEQGVDIRRRQTIQTMSNSKKASAKSAIAVTKKGDLGSQIKKPAKKKASLNESIMKTLTNSSYDNIIRGKVASIAIKNFAKADRRRLTHEALVSRFGQARGSDLYNRIKHLL